MTGKAVSAYDQLGKIWVEGARSGRTRRCALTRELTSCKEILLVFRSGAGFLGHPYEKTSFEKPRIVGKQVHVDVFPNDLVFSS